MSNNVNSYDEIIPNLYLGGVKAIEAGFRKSHAQT